MSGWSFEHSVLAAVPCEFAWAFWTDIANWAFDPSLESVRLAGPFATGTRGTTKLRTGEPLAWLVRHASPGQATIEMELPGAVVQFEWRFEVAGPSATRITQRVSLSGPKVEDHVEAADSELAAGIPQGMKRLTEVMETRWKKAEGG